MDALYASVDGWLRAEVRRPVVGMDGLGDTTRRQGRYVRKEGRRQREDS